MPYHVAYFPDSLVSQYVHATEGECDPDYGTMARIIRERPLPEESVIGPNVAVVHVRVGDVIEEPWNLRWLVPCPEDDWDVRGYFDGEPVFTSQWRNKMERYVMKRRYYEDHIPTLRSAGVGKIVLVGGSHRPSDSFGRSSLYVDLVRDVFRAHGFEVTARLGGKPDDDVVFITRAHYLVQSGGGFSALTASLTRRVGGTVLCSNAHYECDEEHGWGHIVS